MPIDPGFDIPARPPKTRLEKLLYNILDFIANGVWNIPPLSWIVRYLVWWFKMVRYMFYSVLYFLPGGNKRAKGEKVIEAAGELGIPVTAADLIGIDIPEELRGDPSAVAGAIIKKYVQSPTIREALQTMGALIFDSIMGVFEYEGPSTPAKAMEAARSFMALQTGFTGAGLVADLLSEIPSLGQVDRLGDAIQGMYFATGLNWLPWVMLGPITRASIARPLEEYFSEKYRPERFTASQVASLYASRYIDLPTAVEYFRKLGYQERDIDLWLASARRDLSLGEIFDAWDKGILDEQTVIARLQRLGYKSEDIPILIQTHRMEQQDENVRYYIGSLRKALREGLIDPAEFRNILSEMGVAKEAIDLEIELAKLDAEDKIRDLSTGHIKKAYITGTITEEEARHALMEIGYSGYSIDVLIRTWNAERAPKVLKLNRTNIINAWLSGAISERKAREKLSEIGYTPEDIDIIIEDTKLRHPEIPAYPEPLKPPKLPLSVLRSAYIEDVVDRDEVEKRLADAGWTPEDIKVIIATWTKAKEEEPRPLTPSAIERAFKSQVISEETARKKLAELGYKDEDIETMIRTWIVEAEYPIKWPSVDALATALEYGIIEPADVMKSLTDQGYPESVARMYLQIMLHKPPPHVTPIPRTKIEEAYREEIIDKYEALMRLTLLDYTLEDAELLLRLVRNDWRGGNIVRCYTMGLIPYDLALKCLVALGVPEEEAKFYLETGGKAEWRPE